MQSVTLGPLTDPIRVAAVNATGLVGTAPEEAFDRLTRLAAKVLRTPMAFVTLLDDKQMYFKSRVGVELESLPVEESLCQYVVSDGDTVVAGHAAVEPRLMRNPSIDNLGIAAYMGVPFRSRGGHVLGAFCVADGDTREWSEDDVATLTALAEVASNEIALRESYHLAAEFATTLQRTLLPPVVPTVDGLDVAAAFIPANDGFGVLGDFYDVFETQPDRWFVALGDVRGHGPPAAETVTLARWSIRAAAARTHDTDAILRSVNHQLQTRPSADAPHLTCLLATLCTARPDDVTLQLTSAGHPPPLIVRADGGVEILAPGGRPLGVIDDPATEQLEVSLGPGDMLLMLTDGVTETGKARGAMLGHPGVAGALLGLPADATAQDAIDMVLDEVAAFQPGPPVDDIALVCVKRPV